MRPPYTDPEYVAQLERAVGWLAVLLAGLSLWLVCQGLAALAVN